MNRKSGISPVDQTAISALEAATRAAEEEIAKLMRLVAESKELTEKLKQDAQNRGQKNDPVSSRAEYMKTKLQQTVASSESLRAEVESDPVSVEPTHEGNMQSPRQFADSATQSMSDTRDLIRLQILAFVDYLEGDKKLKEEARSDADLIGRLKSTINIVLDDLAFDEMFDSLSSILSHSRADSDCSERYRKLKDSVLKNCESYVEANSERVKPASKQSKESEESIQKSIQKSIDNVTYALGKYQAIKENLGKDKFSYLINVMRGCVSEDDIDHKLFMVGRIFPKINPHLANIARKNLELYRVEGLPAQKSSLAEKNEYPQNENKSAPNLFQPPPRPSTPLPRRVKSDGSENRYSKREVPPTPTPKK